MKWSRWDHEDSLTLECYNLGTDEDPLHPTSQGPWLCFLADEAEATFTVRPNDWQEEDHSDIPPNWILS